MNLNLDLQNNPNYENLPKLPKFCSGCKQKKQFDEVVVGERLCLCLVMQTGARALVSGKEG